MQKMKSDLSGFDVYTSADWDGEGADAVSPETLALARDLVSSTQDDIGLPDAAPSVTGALGLVWNVDSNYIYVSLRNPTTAMFYRRGPNGLTEDIPLDAFSAEDLLKELTEKLLNVRVTTVLENPQSNVARTFISIESPYLEFPQSLLSTDPDDWSTIPDEMMEVKVA